VKKRSAVMAVSLLCFLLAAVLLRCSCGGGGANGVKNSQVLEAAAAFLDACGNLEGEAVRSFLSQEYLQSNQVPESITAEDIIAALGQLNSYRLAPDTDIKVEGDRAVVTVNLSIKGREEKEETLVLRRYGGEWKVDGFTAMNWASRPVDDKKERVGVEEALRDFLIACIDKDTAYIYAHLSEGYRKKYRLEKPWTAAEFSGIFGTARSYDFDPDQISLQDGEAWVDVTIEFGSRGNLESETAEVLLIKRGNDWLIDAFPFFIY